MTLSGDWVEVEIHPNTACDSCGLRVLCSPKGGEKRLLRLPNPGGLLQGQQVRLAENGLMTLRLAGLQYGLPLLGFVGGILLTWSQIQSPLWATTGGVAGLTACAVASYAFIRHWARQRSVVFFRILS